jgi:hypothetical protein
VKKKRNVDIEVALGIAGSEVQKPAVGSYQTETTTAGGEQGTVHI